MMWVYFGLYLGLGAFAGLSAGLLGVGGGVIIVPVLAMLFQAQGMDSELVLHLAIGTSLASIVLTSISSVWAHHLQGAVLWAAVRRLAPGIVIGAWVGALLAHLLSTSTLRYLFGVFEVIVALQMALNIRPHAHRQLPGLWGLFAVGQVIGAVSSLLGIGGGTLSVPFLTWCNVSMGRAVATSAACGLPIAVAGSFGFVVTGWGLPILPAYTSGFVFWPAFVGIVLSSMYCAPIGAKWAHQLQPAQLKRVFAGVIFVLGMQVLLAA